MSKHFHLGESKEEEPVSLETKIRAQIIFFVTISAIFAIAVLRTPLYSGHWV